MGEAAPAALPSAADSEMGEAAPARLPSAADSVAVQLQPAPALSSAVQWRPPFEDPLHLKSPVVFVLRCLSVAPGPIFEVSDSPLELAKIHEELQSRGYSVYGISVDLVWSHSLYGPHSRSGGRMFNEKTPGVLLAECVAALKRHPGVDSCSVLHLRGFPLLSDTWGISFFSAMAKHCHWRVSVFRFSSEPFEHAAKAIALPNSRAVGFAKSEASSWCTISKGEARSMERLLPGCPPIRSSHPTLMHEHEHRSEAASTVSLSILTDPDSGSGSAASSGPAPAAPSFKTHDWTILASNADAASLASRFAAWSLAVQSPSVESREEVMIHDVAHGVKMRDLSERWPDGTSIELERAELVEKIEVMMRAAILQDPIEIPSDAGCLRLVHLKLLRSELNGGHQQVHYDVPTPEEGKRCVSVLFYCVPTQSTAVPILSAAEMAPAFGLDELDATAAAAQESTAKALCSESMFQSFPVEAGQLMVFKCTVAHHGIAHVSSIPGDRILVYALFSRKLVATEDEYTIQYFPLSRKQHHPHGPAQRRLLKASRDAIRAAREFDDPRVLGGRTILVADADPLNSELLQNLQTQGYLVTPLLLDSAVAPVADDSCGTALVYLGTHVPELLKRVLATLQSKCGSIAKLVLHTRNTPLLRDAVRSVAIRFDFSAVLYQAGLFGEPFDRDGCHSLFPWVQIRLSRAGDWKSFDSAWDHLVGLQLVAPDPSLQEHILVRDPAERVPEWLVSMSLANQVAGPLFRIGVEPTLSQPNQPVQLGLFATAFIAPDSLITLYGGMVGHSSEYGPAPLRSMSHGHRIPDSDDVLDGAMTRLTLPNIIPTSNDQINALHHCIAELLMDALSRPMLPQDVSPAGSLSLIQSGVGFLINDCGPSGVPNCAYALIRELFQGNYRSIWKIVATQQIAPQQQLLIKYNTDNARVGEPAFIKLSVEHAPALWHPDLPEAELHHRYSIGSNECTLWGIAVTTNPVDGTEHYEAYRDLNFRHSHDSPVVGMFTASQIEIVNRRRSGVGEHPWFRHTDSPAGATVAAGGRSSSRTRTLLYQNATGTQRYMSEAELQESEQAIPKVMWTLVGDPAIRVTATAATAAAADAAKQKEYSEATPAGKRAITKAKKKAATDAASAAAAAAAPAAAAAAAAAAASTLPTTPEEEAELDITSGSPEVEEADSSGSPKEEDDEEDEEVDEEEDEEEEEAEVQERSEEKAVVPVPPPPPAFLNDAVQRGNIPPIDAWGDFVGKVDALRSALNNAKLRIMADPLSQRVVLEAWNEAHDYLCLKYNSEFTAASPEPVLFEIKDLLPKFTEIQMVEALRTRMRHLITTGDYNELASTTLDSSELLVSLETDLLRSSVGQSYDHAATLLTNGRRYPPPPLSDFHKWNQDGEALRVRFPGIKLRRPFTHLELNHQQTALTRYGERQQQVSEQQQQQQQQQQLETSSRMDGAVGADGEVLSPKVLSPKRGELDPGMDELLLSGVLAAPEQSPTPPVPTDEIDVHTLEIVSTLYEFYSHMEGHKDSKRPGRIRSGAPVILGSIVFIHDFDRMSATAEDGDQFPMLPVRHVPLRGDGNCCPRGLHIVSHQEDAFCGIQRAPNGMPVTKSQVKKELDDSKGTRKQSVRMLAPALASARGSPDYFSPDSFSPVCP
jgi:hypothetical protein